MKRGSRWKIFVAMGCGAFALGIYSGWKTWLYAHTSNDTVGAAIFAAVALCLLVVAALHWYMAAGFGFGSLDAVSGSLSLATLEKANQVVVAAARIQFVRKFDVDNLTLTANERDVFFICGNRPWVCKEAAFLSP